MKRSVLLTFVIFCAFITALAGCVLPQSDPFAVFRAGFYTEIEGELHGVAFEARAEAPAVAEGGVLPLTVTLYAPSGLAGTVLRRSDNGSLSISGGEISFVPKGIDFSALFALFPTAGEVVEVGLDQEGRTRVVFVGGELLLSPDGVPISVRSAAGEVRFTVWRKGQGIS